MNGDPGLTENITGLRPDKEKHSSEFIVQPVSDDKIKKIINKKSVVET